MAKLILLCLIALSFGIPISSLQGQNQKLKRYNTALREVLKAVETESEVGMKYSYDALFEHHHEHHYDESDHKTKKSSSGSSASESSASRCGDLESGSNGYWVSESSTERKYLNGDVTTSACQGLCEKENGDGVCAYKKGYRECYYFPNGVRQTYRDRYGWSDTNHLASVCTVSTASTDMIQYPETCPEDPLQKTIAYYKPEHNRCSNNYGDSVEKVCSTLGMWGEEMHVCPSDQPFCVESNIYAWMAECRSSEDAQHSVDAEEAGTHHKACKIAETLTDCGLYPHYPKCPYGWNHHDYVEGCNIWQAGAQARCCLGHSMRPKEGQRCDVVDGKQILPHDRPTVCVSGTQCVDGICRKSS